MKLVKPIKTLFALTALTAAMAQAEIAITEEPSFAREGHRCDFSATGEFLPCYYLGLGYGLSWLAPDASEVANWDVESNLSHGPLLTAGWQFHPMLQAEATLAYAGSSQVRNNQTDATDRIDYLLPAAWLVGKWAPMSPEWALLAKLGGAYGITNARDSGTPVEPQSTAQLVWGLGASWQFDPDWQVRIDANTYDRDVRHLTLSALYTWGERRTAPIIEPEPEPEPAPLPIFDEKEICEEFGKALDGVNFETDSANLTSGARQRLDRSVEVLLRNPELSVEIGAHTDSVGSADYNLGLSQRRAESVMMYLIASGISANRMSAVGYGLTRPIASNDTAEGRAENRRVELRPVPEILCETVLIERQ